MRIKVFEKNIPGFDFEISDFTIDNPGDIIF
jgi:hypothetical protein